MPLVRKESPEEVIVRISPSRNTIIVQERSPGGVLSYREIDPVEFYYALNGSCVGDEYISSGFLPEHCLHVSMNAAERRFVIWNPDLRADVIYRDTEYMDFPLPRLVFGLRVLADGRVADCSMGVVADEPPTEDNVAFWWQSKIEHSFGHAWPENFIQCCFQEPQLHERCDVPPLFFHFLAAMIIV